MDTLFASERRAGQKEESESGGAWDSLLLTETQMCQEEAGLVLACLLASLEHQTRGQKAARVSSSACVCTHLRVGARSLAGCMCAFRASLIAQ